MAMNATQADQAAGEGEGVSTLDVLQSSIWFTLLLPLLSILIGVACIILNAIVVKFFHHRKSKIINLICYSLSLSDFVTGVGALLQGVFMLVYNIHRSSYRVTFTTFYVICQISMRTSAAYNVFLTVARTWALVKPLPGPQDSRRAFIVSIVIVAVVWTAVVVFEVVNVLLRGTNLVISFVIFPRAGGIILHEACRGNDACVERFHDFWNKGMVLGVPFIIPSVICFFSAIYQIYRLLVKRRSVDRSSGTEYEKTMRTTIFMLTCSFFLCNSMYVIVLWILYLEDFSPSRGIWFIVISNHFVHINSMVTPAILIFRGKQINRFANDYLDKLRGRFRSSVHKMMVPVPMEQRTANSFV